MKKGSDPMPAVSLDELYIDCLVDNRASNDLTAVELIPACHSNQEVSAGSSPVHNKHPNPGQNSCMTIVTTGKVIAFCDMNRIGG